MRRPILCLLLATSLALSSTACQSTSRRPTPESSVLSVTIDQGSALSLGVGQEVALSVTVAVAGGASDAVSWSASCGGIVASGGTATYTAPLESGSCVVTVASVADASKEASLTVTVLPFEVPPAVLSVTIDQGSALSLGVGQEVALSVTVTVAGGASDAVSWSASCGGIVASGGTAAYTAPLEPGSCVVTVASVADASKEASLTVTVVPVEAPPGTVVEIEAGVDEEEWEFVGGVVLGVPRDFVVGSTPVTVTLSDAGAPGQPVGVDPIGTAVRVEFPLEALSSSSDAEMYVFVPPSSVSPASDLGTADAAGAALMETRFRLADGSYYVALGYYDPADPDWQLAVVERHLLDALAAEYGLPGSVSITVQPVDISRFDALEAQIDPLGTTSGLYRIRRDGYAWGSMQAACPDDGNRQSLPPWVTRVHGPVVDAQRQPVVLIHGWQVLSNIAAGASYLKTPWEYILAQRNFVPLVCDWQHLIDYFFEAGLDDHYDLYSFGYDSDFSVEASAAQLSAALSQAFGTERVLLITHSMGGLVANTHVLRRERANVGALLTLGTPYRGSSALACMEAAGLSCSKAQVHPVVKKESLGFVSWFLLSVFQGMVTKHQSSRDLSWDEALTWERSVWGRFFKKEFESIPNPWLAASNVDASVRDLSFYTSFFGDVFTELSGDPTYDDLQQSGFDALWEVTDGIVPVQSATLNWHIDARTRWEGVDHSLIAGGGAPKGRTSCGAGGLSEREVKRCAVLGEIADWLRQNVGKVYFHNTGLPSPTDSPVQVEGPFGYHRTFLVPYGFAGPVLTVLPGTYAVSTDPVEHPQPGLEYRPSVGEVVVTPGRAGSTFFNYAGGGIRYWLYGGAVPNVSWTRQFGTPSYDVAWGVSVDPDGNVLVTGDTRGALAAPGHGTGDIDAYVRKYSPAGDVLWTRQFGSSSHESARAVATNAAGDVAVAGWTWGGLDAPSEGLNDAFVRLFNADGDTLWTAQFGGTSFDYAMDVAFDPWGNVVIGGDTLRLRDDGYFWTDIFINKYTPDGALAWSYAFGVPGDHLYSSGIAVDSAGSVIIGAYTSSIEAVVVKVNGSGLEQWVRRFGACDLEESECADVIDVATDLSDNVLVTGSWSLPSGSRYLRKYDAHGSEMWTRGFNLYGGSRTGLAVDQHGDVLLVGRGDFGGGVVKLHASGAALWATWFGADAVHDVAVGVDGAVAVVGEATDGLGGPSAGGKDAFVRRYGP